MRAYPLLVVVGIVMVGVSLLPLSVAGWWNDDYPYRRIVYTYNRGDNIVSGTVELNIDTSFEPIRLVKNNQPLRWFRDSGGYANDVYVQIPTIEGGLPYIELYYGNPNVSVISPDESVFSYYRDFSATPSLGDELIKLQIGGNSAIMFHLGRLRVIGGDGWGTLVILKQPITLHTVLWVRNVKFWNGIEGAGKIMLVTDLHQDELGNWVYSTDNRVEIGKVSGEYYFLRTYEEGQSSTVETLTAGADLLVTRENGKVYLSTFDTGGNKLDTVYSDTYVTNDNLYLGLYAYNSSYAEAQKIMTYENCDILTVIGREQELSSVGTTYDITVRAIDGYTESGIPVDVSLDGHFIGYTRLDIGELSGTHTIEVPQYSLNNLPFVRWNTGSENNAILVNNGGMYVAYYGKAPTTSENIEFGGGIGVGWKPMIQLIGLALIGVGLVGMIRRKERGLYR